MVYQIKTFSTPEEFNESFIMHVLQWMACALASVIFIASVGCFVFLGVWFLAHQNSSMIENEMFSLSLIMIFLTIALLIPFKICAVACEDLTMNEDCMPSKKASHRSRNGGYYYITR